MRFKRIINLTKNCLSHLTKYAHEVHRKDVSKVKSLTDEICEQINNWNDRSIGDKIRIDYGFQGFILKYSAIQNELL
ncbi:MAG: hypothetical protein MHMPM18_002688 [Marteilia pararefringens]